MSVEVYRKRVFCADLKVGDMVHEVFCLARVERRQRQSGDAFLRLSLVDRSGELAGVAWDEVDALLDVLVEGEYARLRGEIGDYRGDRQLKVVAAERVTERIDPAEYLPRGAVPAEESIAAIRSLVGTIEAPHLRALLDGFLSDPEFVAEFSAAPAAKVNHHAYVGGLAEHTASVMRLCALAAGHYGELDRDLLLAGAFCHDIGKIAELAVAPGFPYTDEGSLLGHIPLGFAMVRERARAIDGFPEERATDLGHLVLSHQGELEWGSPVQPLTLEALVLHFLDNLDSKVATARAHLSDVESGRTAYVRALGRSLFRRPTGPTVAREREAPEPPARAGGGPEGEGPPPSDQDATPSLFDDLDAKD